jgi:hypothetical protein
MDKENRESGMPVIERGTDGLISVEGDLRADGAAEFERVMRGLSVEPSGEVTLDFSALDVEDGVAVAAAVNSIRELLSRSPRVIIRGAPQILGHNLYRVGMLAGGAVDLVDMRLDEASGF